MSLWQHPRWMAGLCAAAVLGRSETVKNAYTAPTPSGEDYYVLRQLTARQEKQSNLAPVPETEGDPNRPALKMYIGAQNSLENMTNGYDYQETVNTTLPGRQIGGMRPRRMWATMVRIILWMYPIMPPTVWAS